MENKSKLQSPYDEISPINEKTIPEYCLAQTEKFSKEGRVEYAIDGLTGEKRLFDRFDEETKKIASAFYKLGLRKGDVVIHMIKDLTKVAIILNGIWRSNGVVRVSYPDDDFDTLLHRVKESHVKFLLCEAEEETVTMCKNVAAICGWKAHVITVNFTTGNLPSIQGFLGSDDGSDCPEFLLEEDDPCIIMCTSGTTGLPKGAVHTHRGLLYQIRAYELVPFTQHKLNFMSTKATHISGTMLPMIILGSGKTGVFLSNVPPENMFRIADKYKPGFVFGFPPYILEMTEPAAKIYDFSSIEVVLVGGMPITPTTFKTIKKLPNVKDVIVVCTTNEDCTFITYSVTSLCPHVNVSFFGFNEQAYGCTELTLCTISSIPQTKEGEPCTIRDLPDFSMGKLFPGTELQIRDVETNEILGSNQNGEICLKSPGLFHSYLLNEEATANAFVDGYFKTGDIGYFDDNGFIYVVDRLKEIFKYGGSHISPSELENVIGNHPNVSQVCVVGVPYEAEHVPRAFVTLHSNVVGDRSKMAEEIKQFANGKLASYKHLRGGLYIIDEFPKGKTGKISRQLVQELEVP